MRMEQGPSHLENSAPQIPLFVENLPTGDKPLSEENIKDLDLVLSETLASYIQPGQVITGPNFLKLFKRAMSFGVTDSALKKYLSINGVDINSNSQPEPETTIKQW